MTRSNPDPSVSTTTAHTVASAPPQPASEATPSVSQDDRLLAKLLEASSCERSGDVAQAVRLYREIVAEDAEGTWGQSASKALDTLGVPVSEASTVSERGETAEVSEAALELEVNGAAATGGAEHDDGRAGEIAPRERASLGLPTVPRSMRRAAIVVDEGISISRLRWSALGAAALPVVAIAAGVFWWVPGRFEQRLQVLEQTSEPQTALVLRQEVEALLARQRLMGAAVGLVTIAVSALSVNLAARALSGRMKRLLKLEARRSLLAAKDEVGTIARAFEALEVRKLEQEQQLAAVELSKQNDLEAATRETQRLQQQVIALLVQIEEVRSGNLTARAPTIDGKVGSIADAFNATIDSLRYIVTQVVDVTKSLTEGARSGESSVRQVSDSALQQSQALKEARENVAEMVASIDRVSELTQSSAEVAREAIEAAREGDVAMDRTVVSMDKIRTAVSNTSKRAKRLAEAAQEVSQILAIVTGISEQANLLAFNASIEAARAGEQGQGFRQVSDEVRNLAAQVSESAGDIERLVQSIQEETSSVIDVLEVGTSEVVSGTQLVNQTQKTLSHLSSLSRRIDSSLQRVATNTVEQTETSQQVNQTMQSVAGVSLANAEAAQEVVAVLQQLLREVSTLQKSVDRFQI